MQDKIHSVEFMPPLTKLIGHRGLRGLAPENTLASFNKAYEQGFSWVEFDVMLTACGEAVVFHDHLLGRTTNGKGYVARKTYAELYQLDAGSWFDPLYTGEAIPTLARTLELLSEKQLQANIEIKPTRGTDIATAQKVLEIIDSYWPKQAVAPLISSFSLVSLYAVRQLNNQLPLGILYHKLPRGWQKAADELACASIHLHQHYINLAQINAIKTTNRLVLAYTVNDNARADLLFNWGVDAVFTDYPLQLG